jgi:hypothetical protein
MSLKRACLVPGLLAGLLLAGGGGCATSAAVGGDDAATIPDGGKVDRAVEQQDAPPFFQDTAPLPDGYQDDAAPSDAVAGDGTVKQDAATTLDGGTCYPEADEAVGGDDCLNAVDKGSVSDVASARVLVSGNLWPGGDVDWYKVTFVDSPDDGQAQDKFNARITFTADGNPGGVFAFDVLLGDCTTAPACGTAGDKNTGITVFEWSDSGENPCNADPVNTLPGVNVCVDHTMVLKLRVFRVSGSPSCAGYELSLDNG